MSDPIPSDSPMTSPTRTLADQAFSRAAGAPLISGNRVRLLRDARENYPAWLEAIAAARHHVHFENYIFREDATGEIFAEALMSCARSGVSVRVIYDWLGGVGRTSRSFWTRLRAAGVEVRCYNPPSLDAPFGWLSRDHRKLLVVDGEVGFVAGLCIAQMWSGQPEKNIEPWRDTGIEVRGPAVAEIERAFAQVWAMMGKPIPHFSPNPIIAEPDGGVSLRIVATVPATAGMFRVDQLVAGLARERVWLTDAYFAGTSTYVLALNAAARDGVDVRLLVPGATDIPVLRAMSRAGYRSLLEAGVRVFEWNGTMLHAKTAVADGRWARVGSTNLNLASWLGNCELDAVIEDEAFAREMEAAYLEDLTHATEIVLNAKRKTHAPQQLSPTSKRLTRRGTGSAGRAAAGALRVGNAISASFSNRRTMEPVEARLMAIAGVTLLLLGSLFAFFPKVLAYPAVALLGWISLTLLRRAYKIRRRRK